MRAIDLVCLAIAIGAAGYVYSGKHDAELAHSERRGLEREIATLSQDVSLLEADLAALEQPARLTAVVNELPDAFALGPIRSRHYMAIDDIPFRQDLVVEEPGDDALIAEDPVERSPSVQDIPGALDLLVQQLTGLRADQGREPDPMITSSLAETPNDLGEQFPSGDGIGDLLQQFGAGDRP